MANVRYGWRRFWCAPTASVALTPEGYLADPEETFLSTVSANPTATSLDGINSFPCLALLGEPGMGKSVEMADQVARQRSEGHAVLEFHLRDYQTDLLLRGDIFGSPVVQEWATGDGILTLVLDGLDEGLLSIKQLATLLPSQFARIPVDRLRLRIACRTAEWPEILETKLRDLWGEERVRVYELLPLRLMDVAAAARTRLSGKDQRFISEIARQGLGPLAAKPVTLEFLLNLYARQGGFPNTQADLYLRGCGQLCEENDLGRRAAGRTGALDSRRRLAVAGRIAAATVLGGRAAVWIALDRGDVPTSDITIRALTGSHERTEGEVFAVGESDVRETLGTGLFSSRGAGRLGWAHQTYAEFLAAWYLVENGVPIDRILDLLLHEDGRVVPQLHEVAARTASLEPEIFRALLNADSLVLLRGDVANAAEQDRSDLVATLLEAFDEGKLLDRDWGLLQHYRKLAHPGLPAQLRPYIVGKNRNPVARRAAADIAEACACREVQDELAIVALDSTESILLRMNAALAVARIGDALTRARLHALATDPIEGDNDDELKGAALTAVWPDILPVEEMFAALAPPKNASLYGNYEAFLTRHVASRLRIDDLVVALSWVEHQPDRESVPFGFRRIMDDIFERAWEHLDAPGVLSAFATTALARLSEHEPIAGDTTNHPFRSAIATNDDKRRRVLAAMVPLLRNPTRDWVPLVHPPTPFALAPDLTWMLDRLRHAATEAEQQTWSILAARVCAGHEWTAERVKAILAACDEFPVLATELSWLVNPVTLGSPEAMRQKEMYQIQHGDGRRTGPLLQPSPAERIATLLDRFETGNLDAWWQLNRDLTLEPDSTHYNDVFNTSLVTTPGWHNADEATRARILGAAKRYIVEYEPDTSAWLGKNVLHYPSAGGYRALRLLLEEEPGYLVSLNDGCWRRWAPIALGFPVFTANDEGGEEVQHRLVALAYRHVPDEMLRTLAVLMHQQNAAREDVSILGKVAECWDSQLTSALLVAAKDPAFTSRSQATLLQELLDHNSIDARGLAEAIVAEAPTDQEGEERRFFSARNLVLHTPDAGWEAVWPAIQGDAAFGRQLVEAIAYADDRHAGRVASRLTEGQLARLYRWLVREYPPHEDPGFGASAEFTSMTPRMNVALWRDGLVSTLKSRGTREACTALEWLVSELTELEWLKWTLDDARAIRRQETWLPARPEDIVRLAEEGRQMLDQERSAAEAAQRNGATRRAIILTALAVEYRAVRHQLQNLREETHEQGTVYEVGTFSAGDQNWAMLIAVIGAGNVPAALEAERAIAYFRPEVAFFVGVAGGVKDVVLGDVVAATKIYGYEAGKDCANAFAIRPDVGESAYRLVQRARAEARKNDWRQRIAGEVARTTPTALVAPIAAGEKVIGSARSETAKFLQSNYGDTLAVEMEGRGFLAATHANASVAAIVIRGISDLLSGKTQADRADWQDRAAHHASAFAFELLAKLK